MNHDPLNPDNWHQGLDVTALCLGGEDPTTARQYAVQKPGERPSINGDQQWVRDGSVLQVVAPGARVVARTITISYGEWEDCTPVPNGDEAVIRCLISGLDGEQIATSRWEYEQYEEFGRRKWRETVQRWTVGGHERTWSSDQIVKVIAVYSVGEQAWRVANSRGSEAIPMNVAEALTLLANGGKSSTAPGPEETSRG